jgi:hypothetical protein
VKLSVKWLAGLAVLVLAVVAVVGSSSATKAATGSLFVANEWSLRSSESPAATGYTTASTIYGTTSEPTVRMIQTNADLIRVIVTDTGKDTLTGVTVSGASDIAVDDGGDGPAGDDNVLNTVAGQQVTIFLEASPVKPIAGANSTIKMISGSVDIVASGVLTIVSRYDGVVSPSADPWIRVQRNSGSGPITISDVVYQTSALDTVNIHVTSELEVGTITVSAIETGLSTARFVGFVRLVPSSVTFSTSSVTPGDTAAKIRTTAGPIDLTYTDSDSATRSAQVRVDTAPPSATVTGPVNGSATQNQTPTFSGSISDGGSGLKINQIKVLIDDEPDAANAVPIVSPSGVTLGTALDLAPTTSGSADGDPAFSFSKPAATALPNGITLPDHLIDWVIKATDVAGNIGFSDADPSSSTATGNGNILGGYQIHKFSIDRIGPKFSIAAGVHKTGVGLDSTSAEVVSRNTLRVVFDDQVTNVQPSDFVVTLDSLTTIVPTSVSVVNNPTAFPDQGVVYLTFATNLLSSETPQVDLQDQVLDIAGNSTSQGTAQVVDGIGPSISVVLKTGTGTGTGAEGPAQLTKSEITIEVTSDEPLQANPLVQVNLTAATPVDGVNNDGDGATDEDPIDGLDNDGDGLIDEDRLRAVQVAPTALSQGTNIWRAVFPKTGASGDRAVVVTATDTAGNKQIVGAEATKSFALDVDPPVAVVSVSGGALKTDQTRPFITVNFSAVESRKVVVKKIQLDGTDVTADLVASSDGVRFFIAPTSDLALGEHTVLIEATDAVDAAGNENAKIEKTFTIVTRATFDIDVFAGWVALSFPSDPIDPDINSVFTNAGHDAVLGFDPSVPGGWLVSVRDTVSGLLEPATENGLSSVRSTQAYWVHSRNFEPVKVLLIGETLPAAGSPPAIVTIPTVLGFNAVPVVDTSRKLTTGSAGTALVRQVPGGGTTPVTVATYLGAVTEGRVYRWDPEILSYVLLSGSTAVNTGEVLFVEVTGTPVPIFP